MSWMPEERERINGNAEILIKVKRRRRNKLCGKGRDVGDGYQAASFRSRGLSWKMYIDLMELCKLEILHL